MNELTEEIAVYCSSIWNCSGWPSLSEELKSESELHWRPLPLYLISCIISIWPCGQPEPGTYFSIWKCESLPRTTHFAPSFCYRLKRRDAPQISALIVRLILGKTKGLPMFAFAIVGRIEYNSKLCYFQPPSDHVLLSWKITQLKACWHWWCSWASRNVNNGYFRNTLMGAPNQS